MEDEIIFVVEESPEGGWAARALGHSILLKGNLMSSLKKILKKLSIVTLKKKTNSTKNSAHPSTILHHNPVKQGTLNDILKEFDHLHCRWLKPTAMLDKI